MTDIWYKDPDARLDYTWDWASWLVGADEISAASFTVTGNDAALVVEEPPSIVAPNLVVVFINGGTVGESYRVTCHATSTDGRIDDWTKLFIICEK